jgi:hypothetical protein
MGIKHLIQENPNFDINLIRIISKFDPSKTNKITPLLVKIFKDRIKSFEDDSFKMNGIYSNRLEYLNSIFNNTSGIETYLMTLMVDNIYGGESIETLNEFNEALEKGLVDEKDISSYKSMEDVVNQLSIARTKELLKKARKEILVAYEDDTVLMLKPLSFEASLKYGSGTKWCTAMKNDPEYFYRYSKNGILIYVINKVTNRKFGCFSDKNEPRVQIFNEVDTPIDSFNMGLPYENLVTLMELLDTKKYPVNRTLFSEEEHKNFNKYFISPDKMTMIGDPMEAPMNMEEEVAHEQPIMEDYGNVRNVAIPLRLRRNREIIREGMDMEMVQVEIDKVLDSELSVPYYEENVGEAGDDEVVGPMRG